MKALSVVFVCACTSSGSGVTPDSHAESDATVPLSDAGVDGDVEPGCHADSECASGACEESTGQCLDEARVLYVATTGSDAGTCTRSAPCASIAHAVTLLSPSRDAIALAAGRYAGSFTIGVPAILSGPSRDPREVELTSVDQNHIIVMLNTAEFTLEGLSIGGNTVMNAPQAVSISSATVTLDRVVVHDNDETGLWIDPGTLTVRHYEAFNNAYGILAGYTTSIDVDGAYVHDNHSSGLAAAKDYKIQNTVLAHNAIGFIPFNGNTGTLQFVTFANQTSTVISSTHAITADSCIFANNPSAPSMPVAITYSLFTGATTAGTGNFVGDPAFVDAGHGDHHLGPTSAAIDRANPMASLEHDMDGVKRPKGAAPDVGAYERP